jgi:hypothetical protein
MFRLAMSTRTITWYASGVAALGLAIASWYSPRIGGVATILLLWVTFAYLMVTQANLELLRHQINRQEKVFLHFDLLCQGGKAMLRVSNLGISNFLVTGIQVRTQDVANFRFAVHQIVQSGGSEWIDLPPEAHEGHPLSVDLEIALGYVGLDVEGKTEPKCFNISMGLDNVPDNATEGLNGLWSIMCPRCKKGFGGLMAMSLIGLTTFEEAFARKKKLEADFNNSCPKHASDWLMKEN